MSLEELVLVFAVLATLSYASISDLRTREVKEYVWVPAALLSVAINLLLGNYDLLQLVLASIPALLVLVFALLDMMGGADFLALLVVTLAHPRIFPKPLTYLTLVYSLVIPVVLVLSNLIYGLRNLRHYKELKCVRGSKTMLLLLGRPKKVSSFLNSKFTYLLTIPVEQQENLFECRASFSMDETYEEKIKSSVRELLEKGILKADDLVWVTPGLPQIVFYLLGYVAALMTPESLLRLIIPLT
ncbi:MAG: A24 family peptidase C-terminal domain-containing protein [Zestosphaera sp.]